ASRAGTCWSTPSPTCAPRSRTRVSRPPVRSADVVGAEAAAGAAPPLGDTAPRDRRRLGVAFWLSVGWIGVVVLAALLADVLPLGSTSHTVGLRGAGPSAAHPFGLDSLGRDLLSRVVHGARVSLAVGFSSVAVS